MFHRRSDLPLRGDANSRFLPWLVAPMVFLSAVALSGAFIVNSLIERWDRDVSGSLTVEIAVAPGEAEEAAERTRTRVDQAIHLLNATPGIGEARALTQEQLVSLLAPWLGSSELLHDLPLPALIDVTLKPDVRLDLNALARKLSDDVPGASIDDHRLWLARLIGLSRGVEALAVSVFLMIGVVTAATVYFATRSGMAVHRDVIEVMHLIGATDGYIAGQFAHRAFVLGLRGGLLGLLLTVPAMIGISFAAPQMQGGFLADLSLPVTGWVAVATLPALSSLLALLTARAAVYRTLARLP
jgi:cell division transport system permease protein